MQVNLFARSAISGNESYNFFLHIIVHNNEPEPVQTPLITFLLSCRQKKRKVLLHLSPLGRANNLNKKPVADCYWGLEFHPVREAERSPAVDGLKHVLRTCPAEGHPDKGLYTLRLDHG